MAKQDTIDFMTAFTIGVTLGIGATLLVRGSAETEAERILRETAPLRRIAEKHARRRRKARGRETKRASADAPRIDRRRAAQGAVDELRGQVADIVTAARRDVTRAARRGVRDAWRDAWRKGERAAKHLGKR
ncbi:MAG: hypothetical protein ACREM1_17265 [Longimicrobiales bacterium]